MLSEFEKSQSAKILSMYSNAEELIKSEGSRGGKVIGHTKSGKPVYDIAGHQAHQTFNAKEHVDAQHLHEKKMEIVDKREKLYHKKQADLHGKLGFSKLKQENEDKLKVFENNRDKYY